MPSTENNENNERDRYRYLQLKAKLGGTATPKQPEMGWGEYLGRGATEALPIAAAAGGGLLGGVPGAGLGYAGGEEAKGLINHYAFGDEIPDTQPSSQLSRVAENVASGATQELGTGLLGKLGAGALDKVRSLKRNIVISPAIDELLSFRKMLPATSGADIDALAGELKGINRFGKVNADELASVKAKLESVLGNEETGPQLRRATVLAQDALNTAPRVKVDPFTKKPVKR